MKRIASVLVLCGALGVAFAPSALACTCGPTQAPLDAMAASDAVFVGLVIQVTPVPGESFEAVSFAVSGYWKGTLLATTTIYTADSDGACGYDFTPGATYIVYASTWNEVCCPGYATGLCTRTNLITSAQEDLDALGNPAPIPTAISTWSAVKTRYRE